MVLLRKYKTQRIFWMRNITVYIFHTVASRCLVNCTPTLPGNGQSLLPLRVRQHQAIYIIGLLGWYLLLHSVYMYNCCHFCWVISVAVARMHVWFCPIHQCMCDLNVFCWTNLRHIESKSVQDTSCRGLIPPTHNGKLPSHKKMGCMELLRPKHTHTYKESECSMSLEQEWLNSISKICWLTHILYILHIY